MLIKFKLKIILHLKKQTNTLETNNNRYFKVQVSSFYRIKIHFSKASYIAGKDLQRKMRSCKIFPEYSKCHNRFQI